MYHSARPGAPPFENPCYSHLEILVNSIKSRLRSSKPEQDLRNDQTDSKERDQICAQDALLYHGPYMKFVVLLATYFFFHKMVVSYI